MIFPLFLFFISIAAAWEQKNNGLTNTNLRSFMTVPRTTGLLFTGTTSGGFFRSTNFGELWTTAGSDLPQNDITALSLLEGSPDLILAGTSGRGIYSSEDDGDSFQPFSLFLPHHKVRCLFTAGEEVLYAGMEDDGLFISRDGGSSWELVMMMVILTVFVAKHYPDLRTLPGFRGRLVRWLQSIIRGTTLMI